MMNAIFFGGSAAASPEQVRHAIVARRGVVVGLGYAYTMYATRFRSVPRRGREARSIEKCLTEIDVLIVHTLNNSRAHRLIWLLEELGLDYEIKFYKRGPDYRAPAELKKVHPLGKSPVLEDDGLVIAESGAIFEYLLEKYDPRGLVPAKGTPERLAYTYWLHYAEGTAMPLLVMKLIFGMIPKQVPSS